MSGFQRVLVPVDFSEATQAVIDAGHALEIAEGVYVELSPASIQALQIASSLAGDHGELRIVHATPPLDRTPVYGPAAGLGHLAGAIEEVHKAAKAAALEAMKKLATEHCGAAKVSFYSYPANALDLILSEAKSFDAQAIVLAASGRSGVARFFLGSTADRVIRNAPCPVMVVPAHHGDASA